MDYSLPLQTVASSTTSTQLDRIQNQALRLICGAMRSTPTAACEIEANVEPLDLRRKRVLTESVERYKRQPVDHPNRQLVENWQENRRLKQKSLLDLAKEQEENHHLPEEREPENKCPDPAPWSLTHLPTIKTSLLAQQANKSLPPSVLKTFALETIDSYPQSAIHAYTDGSAFRATKFAGCGVFLRFPDGSSERLSDSCGNNTSNYEAEIHAIKQTTEVLHQEFDLNARTPTDLIFFSDSSSALEALKTPPFNTPLLSQTALALHNLISAHNITITLQWIPGHCDITGNEIADKLAKEGACKEQKNYPCSMDTVKQILKNQSKEEWLNRWAGGTTGRAYFVEKSCPSKKDDIDKLDRKDQSVIFQFRTGHAATNFHLNCLKPQHEPHCRHCPWPYETNTHILLECSGLRSNRECLLPKNLTIHNTLYGPLEQLKNTATFIRLALADKSE